MQGPLYDISAELSAVGPEAAQDYAAPYYARPTTQPIANDEPPPQQPYYGRWSQEARKRQQQRLKTEQSLINDYRTVRDLHVAAPEQQPSPRSDSTAPVLAGAAGLVLVVSGIVLVLVWLRRRRLLDRPSDDEGVYHAL